VRLGVPKKILICLGTVLLFASAFSHGVEHLAWNHSHGCHPHEAGGGPASLEHGHPFPGMHHHGCTAHEHSPAVLGDTAFLPQLSCAALNRPGHTFFPCRPQREIELPPWSA